MIHLRGASFVYQAPDGEVEALRRVDIDIAPGEFCSVVGPSGCGKSTLLSVVSGLEPLTAGTVEVDGAPVRGPSGKVGFMPQRDQLFPWRTIRDNVTLGLTVTKNAPPRPWPMPMRCSSATVCGSLPETALPALRRHASAMRPHPHHGHKPENPAAG